MEKLIYKYNGDTQIIRFNSAEKFNQYLVENISEIELVEDVEVIDLDATTAPVEVKDAPKADMTVQDVINFLITCKSNGSNVEPIIEYVIDRFLPSQDVRDLAFQHKLTVISDKELAASDLREAGYHVSKNKKRYGIQEIICFLEDEPEDTKTIKNWIIENCSDEEIQSEFKERDLDPDLDYDEIRSIAEDKGVNVINSVEDAIEHLEDEGYACLDTRNYNLRDNMIELINRY